MLSLHANDVLQRVRVLVGFVCTLIVFATFCAGTQHLSGGKMERGDAWLRLAHRSVHGGVVHIVVLTLRCDCGLLCGNGGGWRRVLSCIGTVGSCFPLILLWRCTLIFSVSDRENRQTEKVNKIKKDNNVAVLGWLHIALLRGRWALTVSPTGVAVRLHGAPTTEPCECHAQRHWDCGTKRPRLSFGASDICWPQLGGASGMLHRTGVVMAPRRGISGDGSDAAARRGVE
ncbi:putative retrotransposon hot spot (RHS) protein [Trypanosoma cruzi]|uniref:Putative retrotransposon hot spot (RHS) protein n=1 Tax=Trypanosoma cruzi TaxID=5693 RepID=A0A2V2UZ90_TRYCR|nr:putative retrotransposon hot spot (RHS) protein [Trypanosoma cruzi]